MQSSNYSQKERRIASEQARERKERERKTTLKINNTKNKKEES